VNLAQLLARTARTDPQRVALLVGTQPHLTYGELAARAARLAGHLRGTGRGALALPAGSRVAVCMTNHASYLEVLYGIWWAGLAAVPINAKLHPNEVAYIVDDAQAAAVFTTPDLALLLDPLWPSRAQVKQVLVADSAPYAQALAADALPLQHRAPDDLAWLFYTSGTTGRPKGVMQTHRNLAAMTSCFFIDVDAVEPDDVLVYAAPMSHGAGLYNFAFVARGARHLVPASGGFDPAELCALAARIGRLCFFAAPTMVKRLVEHIAATGATADGFKTIVYGGGPMYVADIQRALDVMGERFVQIYGQGESPMTITALSRAQIGERAHPRWLERLGSVGCAQTLVEVRVVDEHGADVPAGATGEVIVRGDTVMAGYWRNAEATARTLRDGSLWTGDLGALDADGFLTLKDRSKDLIISGGSNIYPREVEEVLLRHPAVREVAVVGQPDADWGEIVVACVVAPGASAEELDALCLAHIARFKRPKVYRFVESLPKNNYGKVLKTALREMLAGDGVTGGT
jgi:long-chain acyl-CoA synthetase